MSLILEVDHLLGVSFAAESPASSVPDWPPQPDRIFSALVAAWAARGGHANERRALEWLEGLTPPQVAASGGFPRTAATVFVPPNDPQTGRVGDRTVMPALRRRQPRRFPAFRPHDSVVRLVWHDADASEETLTALNALATHTSYVGHSSSLTRCRFSIGSGPEQTAQARRRIYSGRVAELERLFASGQRPSPGADMSALLPGDAKLETSTFAARWLVLEHIGGDMPDLRAAALVAKALRYSLMSGYKRTVGDTAIPSIVSGHEKDGSPVLDPHLAIAPLAFLGSQHADGRVYGFALVPPGDGELLDNSEFQSAIRAVAAWNEKEGRRELHVTGEGLDLLFSLSSERALHSLDPAPYIAAARTWATCTPIVLDRHLKATSNAGRDREIGGLIGKACRNIGLPQPACTMPAGRTSDGEEFAIAPNKHSAVRGVPSAYPSGRSPRWMGWRLPKTLQSRQLTHAVLQFEEPVRGPLILGAGRFVGLGLCRALDPQED
jgi:CRISPR-associated protein Csb2